MLAKYRLMVPGPTSLPPEVALGGALPLVDERGDRFGQLFGRLTRGLQQVLSTANDVLLFTSSLTGAFEGALQNLTSPGQRVLIASNGFFGERWIRMARSLGLEPVEVLAPWGEKIDMRLVEKALHDDPGVKVAVCVACETSTGVVNDIRAFGSIANDIVTIVDAASAVGAYAIATDEWGIDVVLAGSQKALMAPPGITVVSVSSAAWEAHRWARTPRFYFDWQASKLAAINRSATPWTPAISVITQLDLAIQHLLREGMEAVFERHLILGRAARAGVRALGLELLVPDDDSSCVVTTAWLPPDLTASRFLSALLEEHGTQLTGGVGPLAERVIRIGHCGYVDRQDLIGTLAAIELTLDNFGCQIALGRSLTAAQEVFATARLPA